ncbi:MAG: WecB/TagA/CpsF family glycosyltransferase [Vulcanimicrobiaceae bacterium]
MSVDILGCRLDPLDADAAVEAIVQLADAHAGAAVVTLGTEMVVYAQRDTRFRAVINSAALCLCDTVGVLAVARKRGATLRQRVTGVELVERLCARVAQTGQSVYFLGGAPGVAAQAAARLQERLPQLRIAGTRDGYFEPERSGQIAGEIARSGAALLFVGMGSPRQEFWLAEWLGTSAAGVGLGVGGSFDVLSGRVARAPAAWRRLGLEWLYRLVNEPSRWRRQLALPYFLWLVLREDRSTRRTGSKSAI